MSDFFFMANKNDVKTSAKELYAVYDAFVQAGFTEAQAMEIMLVIITTVAKSREEE